YALNGSLYEYYMDVEHLDWSAKMRVIMGTIYCLNYTNHDLNPPVSHSNLNSISILLTYDFAAKVNTYFYSISFPTSTAGDEYKKSELPPQQSPETDVYNFGIMLLEITSRKLSYSEEQGHLVNRIFACLNNMTPNSHAFIYYMEKQQVDHGYENMVEIDGYLNLFGLMKRRFLNFKNQHYIKELEQFQSLAKAQYPKVIISKVPL
ncbi:hypothetical protein RYX36_022844, partial [Vicia faba]